MSNPNSPTPGWATTRSEPLPDPLEKFRLAVRRHADTKALVAMSASAVMADWALHGRFDGVGGALMFALVPAALVLTGRMRRPESLVALSLVPCFGIWLAIRTSPELIVFDVMAALLLLAVGASFAAGGSVFDLTIPRLLQRGFAFTAHFLAAPAFVVRPLRRHLPDRAQKATPVLRGLLIIAPVLFVLCGLLASADSVFASLFDVDLAIGNLAGHLALLLVGTWCSAALLRTASAGVPDAPGTVTWRIGAVEAIVGLAAVVALYATFVATQVVVWLGGADHVLGTKGLTYAEHAREGFFQLLAVSVITLVLLMTMRAATRLDSSRLHRWWLVCAEASVLLTIVIVGVALHRLAMYEDAYGLTTMRLYSTVFACWVGAVFVMLGCSMAQRNGGRWFIGTSTALGLAALLVLNIVNPERLVIERNVDRLPSSVVPFDAGYLARLSDDAVPAARDALPKLTPDARARAIDVICQRHDASAVRWSNYNTSRAVARDVRDDLCI